MHSGSRPPTLFDRVGGGEHPLQQPRNRATTRPDRRSQASPGRDAASGAPRSTGLTLDDYASAKGLPVDFLKSLGLSQFTYDGKPAVRIPYFGTGGEEIAVRFRIGLEGDRFRWKSGTKPCLYGLNRLADARKRREWWFWLKGNPTAIPSGSMEFLRSASQVPRIGVRSAMRRHLEGIETIYVVIEPDRGGDAVRQWLSRSTIRHRVKLISLPAKDPSALHLEDPDAFPQQWQLACQGAVAWTAVEAKRTPRSEQRLGRNVAVSPVNPIFSMSLPQTCHGSASSASAAPQSSCISLSRPACWIGRLPSLSRDHPRVASRSSSNRP